MNIKTITTVDGVNVVDFGSAASRFYWIENLGSTVVYVSGNENIVPDGDNVKVLSAGCGTMVENLGGKVYILGAGKFQITNQGDKFPPFRNAPVADGGVMASGNPVQIDGLQGGVPFNSVEVSGKNLIGIAQAKLIIGDSTSGYSVINNATSRTIIQKLQPNTTYHIKKYDSGNRFRIVIFDNEPTNAVDITAKQLIFNADGSISDYTLSTGEDYLWMALATHYATSGEAIEPIVQLEYGDTATEYEPPITGRELTVNVNGTDYTITTNSNPYTVPNDIRQQDGLNVISVSEGELSVTGVRKNAAVKKIWDKIDELTTAIIVSNGETIE